MDRNGSEDKIGHNEEGSETGRRHRVNIGGRSFDLPSSRLFRMGVGIVLILFGLLGFLPVVGFWMIPLGMFVLSIDLHWARRLRRRFSVWFSRRFPKLAEKANGASQSRLPDSGESG